MGSNKRRKNSHVTLTTAERKERVLLNEAERVRATLSAPAYLAWCRQRCRQKGGLEFDSLRAVIWRDLLLLIPQQQCGGPPSASNASIASLSTSSSASFHKTFAVAPSVPYAQSCGANSTFTSNCHSSVLDCDVKRSLWHLYPDEHTREEKRRLVKALITRCLAHRPELHYFQGLHEVVGFIEYTVGAHVPQETLVAMVDQLLAQHFYVFCHESMKSCEAVLFGVHHAVKAQNNELAKVLETFGLGPGTHYALSWVITWFTHHLAETRPSVLARIFDVLLCGTDQAGELITATLDDTSVTSASSGAAPRSISSSFRTDSLNESISSSSSSINATWARHVLRDVVGRALVPASSPWLPIGAVPSKDLALILPPPCIARRHNATIIGLLSASLLLHHADELLCMAQREIDAAGGDTGFAFGRVFSALLSLPNRLGECPETLEAVVDHAVRMATVPPCDERLAMLEKQAEYCDEHGLVDVAACARGEVAALRHAQREGRFKIRGSLVKAAVTTILVAAIAMTNIVSLGSVGFLQDA